MLAREAEVATWSRKKQLYRTTGSTGKSDANSWAVPATGFPPVTSVSRSRPFHVWGHPSPNQSLVYMWPGHPASSPSPPAWGAGHPPPPSLPGDPSFWNCHHQNVSSSLIYCSVVTLLVLMAPFDICRFLHKECLTIPLIFLNR